MLSDFYDSATSQLDLFGENRLFANGEALMGVMDRINRSGRGNYGLRAVASTKTGRCGGSYCHHPISLTLMKSLASGLANQQ